MDYSKIGNHLKLIRERKGLSYDQIFEITRIQPTILKEIEEGSSNISPVFLKGFIKSYARSMGLDPEELFQQLKNKEEIKEKSIDRETKARASGYRYKKIISFKNIVSLGIFLILLSFVLWLTFSFKKELAKKDITTLKPPSLKKKASADPELSFKNKLPVSSLQIPTENDFPAPPETLFNKIKNSVFKQDLLIQSPEPLKIYFKADGGSIVTKTLEPFVYFHIKAKKSIYLRFDENRNNILIFHNGKKTDTGGKAFFEQTFQTLL